MQVIYQLGQILQWHELAQHQANGKNKNKRTTKKKQQHFSAAEALVYYFSQGWEGRGLKKRNNKAKRKSHEAMKMSQPVAEQLCNAKFLHPDLQSEVFLPPVLPVTGKVQEPACREVQTRQSNKT